MEEFRNDNFDDSTFDFLLRVFSSIRISIDSLTNNIIKYKIFCDRISFHDTYISFVFNDGKKISRFLIVIKIKLIQFRRKFFLLLSIFYYISSHCLWRDSPFEMSDIPCLIESSIIISRDKYLTLGKKWGRERTIEGNEKWDFICNLESVVNNLKFKIRKRSAISLLLRRPRFIKSLSRCAISNQASKHFKYVYKICIEMKRKSWRLTIPWIYEISTRAACIFIVCICIIYP